LVLRGSLNFLELQEPRSLFCFGNVIMKLCHRRSRAFRIFENVETVVLTLSDKLDCLLKIVIGLARKADDDIARERQTSAGVLYTIDSFEIVTPFMTATHQFQNPIAT